MSLLSLQKDFRSWLLSADTDAAERCASGRAAGLGIYQNNYRSQLVGCLEGSFQVTRRWIGPSAFHRAVVRHIEDVPPSSWTLDHYPNDFPQTLGRCFPDDPEVAELATLELALEQAFVAPDQELVTTEKLESADWDNAVLRFTQSLQVHDVHTNAAAIWSALTDDGTPPAEDLEVLGDSVLLVWRKGIQSQFRAAAPIESRLLTLARAGYRFSVLCQQIEGDDEIRARIGGECLGTWLATGLIVGISESKT